MSARWFLLPLLAACKGPLAGTWRGTCQLLDDDQVRTLDLTLFVEDDGGALDGSGDVDGHDFVYVLSGEHAGDSVSFTLEGSVGEGGTLAFVTFEGEADLESTPRALAGEGAYWVEIVEDGVSTGQSDPWEGQCSYERES